VTSPSKIAIFMAAAISRMQDMLTNIVETILLSSVWRNATLLADRADAGYEQRLRQMFLSLLVFD
jgi:hypothetical protein